MKRLDDVIAELQALRAVHGNLPVIVRCNGYDADDGEFDCAMYVEQHYCTQQQAVVLYTDAAVLQPAEQSK